MSKSRKELRRIPQAVHLRRILSFQRGMIGVAKRRFAGCRYESPAMQHRAEGAFFSYHHPIEGYLWSRCLKGDPLTERAALAVWLLR